MAYTQYPAGTVLQHESGTITTVEGGTSTAYDTSKWSPVSTPSTGGGTTGGSSFVPTGSTQQEQAASVLAEIQRIQAELTTKQGQLANAQTAGITSGTIPDWVLSGSEMPAGFVWPEDTVLSASSPYKATSEIEAIKKQLEQSALLRQQQYDAAMKEYQTQQKSWLEKLTSQPTVTETRAQLAEKYGITEKEQELEAGVAALEAKQKAYNDAVAQKELALSAERERLAPMEFIAARMTRIERDANIRLNQMAADINVDVAMMEFKAGRLDKAYEFINQAVSDYTADLQWQYQYTTDFMEMNYQLIQDLKSDQQDVLNKVWQLQLLELEQAQTEKKSVLELMLKAPQAGITIEDSLDMATQKASGWLAAQPAETGWATGTPTSYKEWQLAGSPGTYEEWVRKESELTPTEETQKEVESTLKTLKTVYGLNRKQIEEKWKADNGVDIVSPFVSSVLDNLFPDTAMSKMEPEKKWYDAWWNPFTWGK